MFYLGTTYYNGINTLGVMDEEVDALCGWAGDFQALIRDYFEYMDINNTQTTTQSVYALFYPMIGDDDYFCSHLDIITDMDSCNIYEILNATSISNGSGLKAIFSNYYNNTTRNTASRRFTTWIGDLSDTQLISRISKYCNDYSPIPTKKWPILSPYSIYDYQVDAFAEAFADYLLIERMYES